jgi:hypothetical protein
MPPSTTDGTKPSIVIRPVSPGLMGQYSYPVKTIYANGEIKESLFVGSVYGGPIFVDGIRIDSAVVDRCGSKLTPDFIRRFYDWSPTAKNA